jgi:hypothetical protein
MFSGVELQYFVKQETKVRVSVFSVKFIKSKADAKAINK